MPRYAALALCLLALCPLLANSLAAAESGEWRPLFNGKNLDGWETDLGRPFAAGEALLNIVDK